MYGTVIDVKLMCGALGGWMIAAAMYAAMQDKMGVSLFFVGFALFMLLMPQYFGKDDDE